ncbi:non-structural maintenance of chromosomes element 3 homolog [Anopheles maculipalpis]|uniref:non-structural maintenance of chromosomes element 3 homolog n=1 Tax=Anopheles maculipalpis TaxID=1496333 RepID=UPI002159ACC9|nr:non-structural maintenance of chromosomes element 3 homolog [Anopheles maculipalpis]
MSRPTQSQSQRSEAERSISSPPADESHLVRNMVKTILNLSVNKSIIKRSDISHIALKGDARLYNRIIPEVIDILREVYGYKLVDVDSKGQKTMILCSTVETSSIAELNENYRRRYTLLGIMLGYIYMKNGTVPESMLWDFLRTIGIDGQQEHAYFGEPKKLLEVFIKQAYLMRLKQSMEGMNEESIFLSWGVRANQEVSKKEMLESMCKLMNRKPSDFKTQYIETQGMGEDNMSVDGEDESEDVE